VSHNLSPITDIITREYLPEGDYITFKVEDGREFRRALKKSVFMSKESKTCDVSGNLIKKGDFVYSIPIKKKGIGTLYIAASYLDDGEKESNPLTEELELLTNKLTDSLNSILAEQKLVEKDLQLVKHKKDLISKTNSQAHSLMTAILKLEEKGLL